MVPLSILFLILALIASGLAAFGINVGRINSLAAALFFYFLSVVLAGHVIAS